MDKQFSNAGEYIKRCSEEAADYFSKKNIRHDFFQDTSMELSADNCEMLYRDMLEELIKNRHSIAIKYGLIATVTPMQKGDQVVLSVSCGIIYS